MTESLLPRIILDPGIPATASVIWLHGLGASGHDFVPVVPELGLPDDLPVRFIFPHAPEIPVTINQGYVMPAWYDIVEAQIDRRVDTGQLLQSAGAVRALIEHEIAAGVPASRIIVAGFSQGGAVCYQVALGFPQRLAGAICLSTYLATDEDLELHPANRDLPLLVMHGERDPVVPIALGEAARDRLQQEGYAIDYHSYPMEHTVCIEQIRHIGEWMRTRL